MTPELRQKIEQDPGTIKVLHTFRGELHDGFREGCLVCAAAPLEDESTPSMRGSYCPSCGNGYTREHPTSRLVCWSCYKRAAASVIDRYLAPVVGASACSVCGYGFRERRKRKTTLCRSCYDACVQEKMEEYVDAGY